MHSGAQQAARRDALRCPVGSAALFAVTVMPNTVQKHAFHGSEGSSDSTRTHVHTHTRHRQTLHTSGLQHSLCVLVNALHRDKREGCDWWICPRLSHHARSPATVSSGGTTPALVRGHRLTWPSGKHRPKASRSRGVAVTVFLKSLTHTLPSPLASCTATEERARREPGQPQFNTTQWNLSSEHHWDQLHNLPTWRGVPNANVVLYKAV